MEDISKILKDKFSFTIHTIKYIGSGYDSNVYLVNNTYIFKFAKHNDAINAYQREKEILEFLRIEYHHNINIPIIEYYDVSGIIGYKKVEGQFLTSQLYLKMSNKKKEKLISDIAIFLKYLHSLDIKNLIKYKENIQDSFINDLHLLKENIFPKLNIEEQKYIESFIRKAISDKDLFNVPYSLCHNDLSANHILLDNEFNLCGIIDFGDASITQDYRDFVYLLEDSKEEIGFSFGKSILDQYGYKESNKALTYAKLIDDYYPIETIVCGIENEDEALLNKGLKMLRETLKKGINL